MFLRRERSGTHPLSIIHYQRRDRRAVLSLFNRSYRTQIHLDWFEPDAWLDTQPPLTWTAWQGSRLVALLGMSEPLRGASWIRMLAVETHVDAHAVLGQLWRHIQPELLAANIEQAAILLMHDWVGEYVEALGFHPFDQVVTMRRATHDVPSPIESRFFVRSFTPNELSTIIRIDQTAFSAPWQMSATEIRQSERLASPLTVATLSGEIVGYQLATHYYDEAHLARLAVLPQYQGQGVGAALVYDLIQRFARRGIYSITVNTQLTNIHSQRLYRRFGFERTGYDLPVWTLDL